MVEIEKRPLFITVIGYVYVFLMAMGLFSTLQFIGVGYVDLKTIAGDFLKFLLCAFILIRFFFTPSSIIGDMLIYTRKKLSRQLILIVWDLPILLLHAALFYFVCICFWKVDYWPYLDLYTAFWWLATMLLINAFWLFTVSRRLWLWEDVERRRVWRFYIWILNNLSFGVIILYFLPRLNFGVLILLGYLNCLVDIMLATPDYLEQREDDRAIKIFGISFWPRPRLKL